MDKYITKILVSCLVLCSFFLSFSQLHSHESETTNSSEVQTKSYHPAAISFFAVDLKYSFDHGVQVCEIQQSVISKFRGYDFVKSRNGAAAENFCDYLSTLVNNFWYVSGRITDKSFAKVFGERGWKSERTNEGLAENKEFAAEMSAPVYDPTDIHNYHGLLYTRISRMKDLDMFLQDFPGVIVVDGQTYNFGFDKYVMNKLLTDDELLSQIKPAWNLYPKNYSQELIEQIKTELGSDIFVIKPRRSTLGRGIIMVEKENLAKVIKKITKKDKALLKGTDDDAYKYWKKDKNESFIVEAYAPSETVHVPHFDDKPFDPTMRVGVVLVHSEGKTDIHFVACYWKLPIKPLSEKASLTEQHKSYGKEPHFAEVSEEIRLNVERQLSETLPHLFEIMLGYTD